MKTVYQDEKNIVLVENSVEWKPCINREIKSLELTIKLYNCHYMNMKFLVVVNHLIFIKYLSMDINYSDAGKVRITIPKYI